MLAVLLTSFLTFVSGFAYELGCVFWVHHSEQGNSKRAAGWSAFNALTQVVGIGESIREPLSAVCLILGYAVGSYVAIERKRSLQPTADSPHVSSPCPGAAPPRPKGATGFPRLALIWKGLKR